MYRLRHSLRLFVLLLTVLFGVSGRLFGQYYPIHATVQWPAPQSPYLADYSTGSRDRLIVTLLNRDLQQPLLYAKLRLQIKSGSFTARSREEVSYPQLELQTSIPLRLTGIDLAPYLQPQHLQMTGRLEQGRLPSGYAELQLQVIDYYTGRPLSDWHTARAYLDVKKPPFLNLPERDAEVILRDPLFLRFQWTPRHQGLSSTEYEFVLKELPDNGAAPQSAFAYGQEIFRTHTRSTRLSYTHLDPPLLPNRRYAWQVRALVRSGVEEVGMFEHGGLSEVSWFYLNDQCDAPRGLRAQTRYAKVDLSWGKVVGTTGYVVECRPKSKLNVYEWAHTETVEEHLTLAQLKPGWTYEWRVGTRCTSDRPVFSDVREFTLSKQNEALLADCGKEPVRTDLRGEPHLGIRAGDVVTIGGDFDSEALSKKYGQIRFSGHGGRYAFDPGSVSWYQKSVKLDRFYKPFAKDYIAPWKLIPEGEQDVVTAEYTGSKAIDPQRVHFASEPRSTALPASYDASSKRWSISLPSVSSGESYEVFAVYEGEVLGKLRVASYAQQRHKLTLVPINDAKLDKAQIERELNSIYDSVGIHFDVEVDARMRGDYSWDRDGDGKLSVVGKSFFGRVREVKESAEMEYLKKAYTQLAGTLDGVYLFVVDAAGGLETQPKDLLGEMPRRSRFGYIFSGNSPNGGVSALSHTIAHELGHGLFTLQHTFDDEYGGAKSQGQTRNLMDYATGKELAAFQWNVISNPAVFTALDKKKDGELGKQGRIWLTPDWEPFVCDVSNELVSIPQEIPNGTIGGIRYGGQVYTYRSAQKAYVNTTGASLPIQKPSSGDSIFLVNRAEGGCGTIYRGTWAYVLGNRNFNFADSTTLSYVRPVKCVSLTPDRAVPNGASVLYFVGKTSSYKDKILDQLYDELVKRGGVNQLTQNKFTDQVCFAITQQGEDLEANESLAYLRSIYAQVIILQVKVSEDGTISLVNLAPSKPLKSGDAILDFNHIKELIADEPWYMQAILLYELADLLDRGIEHLKIPESVWRCSGEPTVYKRIVSNLFSVLCPQVLITDALLGRRLAEEAKFAFACGLWDGMVDVVQSVPQLVKILTCAFHADCLESAASQWTSFKEAVIEDERGNILCHQDEYVYKIRELISAALAELVSDDCQTAHTIGSIVGPIAAMAVGDLAAGEAVLTRLGSVGSGLKYAIKGLQLCDKVTDITRPLAKGLKVTTALVRKAGKLIPEIRIEGRTILHYVEDKLHIRRFDAATSKVVDTSIEENELGQELTSSIKHNRLSKLIFRNVSFEQFKMTFKATQKEYEEAFLL